LEESLGKPNAKFFKPGTSTYAAAWDSEVNPAEVDTDGAPVLLVQIKVPNGQKADIIATFSGEVAYNGTEESLGSCVGYFQIDNRLLCTLKDPQ
jgi:hypothetical protein